MDEKNKISPQYKINMSFNLCQKSDRGSLTDLSAKGAGIDQKIISNTNDGFSYLDSFLPESEISTLPFDLTIQVPCNGKLIDVKLNDTLKEWKGDGTLDKFFKIS